MPGRISANATRVETGDGTAVRVVEERSIVLVTRGQRRDQSGNPHLVGRRVCGSITDTLDGATECRFAASVVVVVACSTGASCNGDAEEEQPPAQLSHIADVGDTGADPQASMTVEGTPRYRRTYALRQTCVMSFCRFCELPGSSPCADCRARVVAQANATDTGVERQRILDLSLGEVDGAELWLSFVAPARSHFDLGYALVGQLRRDRRRLWHRGKLFEFRVRHSGDEIEAMFGGAPPSTKLGERVLLRVFFHAYGQKIVLLLGGYDKGADTSERRQQREITTARKRLEDFKDQQRRRR